MKVDSLPSPLPVFELIGDQAAALLLQSVGITIKVTPRYLTPPSSPDLEGMVAVLSRHPHYQLRSGPRGWLSKPPVRELAEAIELFIHQGPTAKVDVILPELLLAASLALTEDPLREVVDAAQESIEDAYLLHEIRDRPQDEQPKTENKVIPFPSLERT